MFPANSTLDTKVELATRSEFHLFFKHSINTAPESLVLLECRTCRSVTNWSGESRDKDPVLAELKKWLR
jgi:hypothetical protein